MKYLNIDNIVFANASVNLFGLYHLVKTTARWSGAMIGSKKSKVELYFIYMTYISSLAGDCNAHSTITKPQK
jgi:hypothetical protein